MGLCFKLSNWELRIMRHELADHEWAAIRPILPNRPRDMRERTTAAC
jgi:transposase